MLTSLFADTEYPSIKSSREGVVHVNIRVYRGTDERASMRLMLPAGILACTWER